MENPELLNDIDRLVAVEARIALYRSRRRGVVMRMVLLLLPLSVIAFLIMDLGFSLPIIALLVAAALGDHFIHYGRFRAAERDRDQILAQGNG